MTKMQQTTPKVSIGMPVYNGGKFIREALDSLLAQTFTDFELIISDNASTDETEAICREYAAKDSRIRYVRQEQNFGGAANFEYVLNEAEGEYFMWAAHDDMWEGDYLKTAVTALDGDLSCNYAMPSFKLQSIRFRTAKRVPEALFAFIELEKQDRRFMQYIALHHHSHKCNIVYSLFRRNFILRVSSRQSISNDGLMGALIVYMSRGVLIKGHKFFKRYFDLWPGALDPFYRILKKSDKNFEVSLNTSMQQALRLFPQHASLIQTVFSNYKPYSYGKGYTICDLAELYNAFSFPCSERP